MLSVEEKVSRPHSCRKSFDRNVSGGGQMIGKCSTLNAKTWKCNLLNLNVNLNIAYEKVNVQGKNLNVARGKLNDESVNSDVKQQM